MNAEALNTTAEDIQEESVRREKALKLLLWIGQVSIGMLFAGLTSGYIVRRAAGNWTVFGMPTMFFVSTAIILVSSITMNMASQAVKKDNNKVLPTYLLLTLLLGIGFGVLQYFGWMQLVHANIYFTGTSSNAAGSFLYVITGLHLLHILGGLVALSISFFKARAKRYSSVNHLGIKLCATYWHFLDGLWVYLFIFMLIMR